MTHRITQRLSDAANGDEAALEVVVAWAYENLEKAAAYHLKQYYGTGLPGVTLEPAALVNETMLKLLREPGGTLKHGFESRRHFVGFANKVMMSVLVDYHRRRGRKKRGGDQVRVSLSGLEIASDQSATLLDLTRALDELEELDQRKAETVKLRLLWGLKAAEVARALDVSVATTERDWSFARAWLVDRLTSAPSSADADRRDATDELDLPTRSQGEQAE